MRVLEAGGAPARWRALAAVLIPEAVHMGEVHHGSPKSPCSYWWMGKETLGGREQPASPSVLPRQGALAAWGLLSQALAECLANTSQDGTVLSGEDDLDPHLDLACPMAFAIASFSGINNRNDLCPA